MKIEIQKVHPGAHLPEFKTEGAAGCDLYLPEAVIVRPGRQILPTGLKMAIPMGMEGNIRPRSGYSAKGMEGYDTGGYPSDYTAEEIIEGEKSVGSSMFRFDIDVLVGTIDADYRGEVGVIVKSCEDHSVVLPAHTRIAQMVFTQVEQPTFMICDQLSETVRGAGGFGHTNLEK